MKAPAKVLTRLAFLILLGAAALVAQTPPGARVASRQAPAKAVGLPSATQQPQFKGVFEPVNYNQDLKLLDAFFVTADEGWVSGEKGTILHTSDGGRTWQAQLGGDPQSQGPELKRLFFLDRRHGWAQSWNQLFRTSDGDTWQEVGNDVRGDVTFVSPRTGFRSYGDKIYRTVDGGATWSEAFTCHVQASLGGLMRDVGCEVYALQFVSANVGYGVGTSHENGSLVVKTADGGATWNVVSLALEPGDQRTFTLFFLDENNGFATRITKLYRTSDGGKTWEGMMATLPGGMAPRLKFTDPEVGWSCGGSDPYPGFRLTFTVDSGKHWAARELKSPAVVYGYSLPRRDTAYVVGDHGMVLRYRVVPVTYQAAAHSIDAPAMPDFDSPAFKQVATMKDVLAQLQAKLPASVAAQGSTQTFAQTGAQNLPPSGAANPAPASGQTSALPGGQSSSFPQDTTATNTGATNPAPGSIPNPASVAAAGFQQDLGTGPVAGGYLDSCCGPLIQQLETTATSLATTLPTFSNRFRNLNLILEGLNVVNSIVNQANTLKQSIRALRQAKNAQAAAAALTTVQTQVNGISSTGGFVQDTTLAPQP